MPPAGRNDRITREKIIHAVLDEAFINSTGATSLADISARLGIKKASLYNHYVGRDTIIADTTRFCGEYLKHVTLVPPDLAGVAKKYSAETVLKGITRRWFKVNEKDPLFKIYSFIESEKYFSTDAAKILRDFRKKLTDQMHSVLSSLAEAGKIRDIKPVLLKDYAVLYTSMLRELVDSYIVQRKDEIRTNPEMGEDSLFGALPFEDTAVLDADRLAGRFIALLM
ncbi:MAG: TetR/AcrR family transcriptional regulator [Treponema sp.]|nr:TetR/AcrR family transcriptional regulator [Treponema sp.]